MDNVLPLRKKDFSFEDEIRELTDLCKEDLVSVNTIILDKLDSNVPLVHEVGKYLILSGGKRLRPLLTVSSFHMTRNETSEIENKMNHIGLSAAVEFIHTATLLHDDVIDESKQRRGKPTANEKWKNKTSVLVGDFLFSRAFQLMTKYGNTETLKILADTSVVISEGEVLELANDKNLEINENIYFEVVNAKTASLFSAACQVGSISALGTEAEVNALKSFGTNFGMTFQLIDDAIDYSSNKKILGKNTGDDFKEGKITLPIILAYGRSNDKEKKFWERTISDLNQNDGDFEIALEIINKIAENSSIDVEDLQLSEIWAESFLYKSKLTEHNDCIDYSSKHYRAILYCNDVKIKNGPLFVFPKSHTWANRENVPHFINQKIERKLADKKKYCEVNKGDLLVFDSRLIHGRSPNTTQEINRDITFEFYSKNHEKRIYGTD